MKLRTSFVSNSSSSSFVIRGIKVSLDEIKQKLNLSKEFENIEENKERTEDIFLRIIGELYGPIGLDIVPNENWFNKCSYHSEMVKDYIIGKDTNIRLEDGDLTDVTTSVVLDDFIIQNLEKIGFKNPKLSTFVQMISNDNC